MNDKAKYTLIGIGVGTLVSGLDNIRIKNVERLSTVNPFNNGEKMPVPNNIKKMNNTNMGVSTLKNILVGGSIGYGFGTIKEGNKR